MKKGGGKLDVVVFKGGYGDEYAKAWEAAFDKKWGSKSAHTGTQEITGKLQPRFNGGNPPDIVDDSGAQQIKLDVLYKSGQLLDLAAVLDAPSIDDPTKKVRDTLIPGTLDPGLQGGKVVSLNYIYTVWGLWYSGKLFKEKGWEVPKTWDDFLAICKDAKSQGIGGLAHQGKYPYYINVAIMDLIAKKGGLDAMKAIDNLDPKAFVGSDAAQAAVEAIYEIVEKGYLLPGTNGLTHTESQTRWNQYKAAFITCGSWLENEQLKQTPADFDMKFMPMPLLPDSKLPFEVIRAYWASRSSSRRRPRTCPRPRSSCAPCSPRSGRRSSRRRPTRSPSSRTVCPTAWSCVPVRSPPSTRRRRRATIPSTTCTPTGTARWVPPSRRRPTS